MPSFTTADADDLMQFQKTHDVAKRQGNNKFRKTKQFVCKIENIFLSIKFNIC